MAKLEIQRSALHHHKRVRKELIPPFNQLTPAMNQIFWFRDLVPEFLWLDSLIQCYGDIAGRSVLNDFLSAMDPLAPPSFVLDGTVSSFLAVPTDLRAGFISTHAGKIEAAVRTPFGDILALYPECPMFWLNGEKEGDPNDGVESTRRAVIRLLPGKDDYCARIRTLPIVRHFVHGKVKIVNTLTDLIEALKKYPNGTEDERFHVESFARQSHNMILQERAEKDPRYSQWPLAFWRKNVQIVPCRLSD